MSVEKMDTKKMRACAPLLPEPGDKVICECLDEIDRLRKTNAMENTMTHETELLERAERAEASNYIHGQNNAYTRRCTATFTTRVLLGDFSELADFLEERGAGLPPEHENPCGFPDTVKVKDRAYEFSARNFAILLHVIGMLWVLHSSANIDVKIFGDAKVDDAKVD